MSRIIRYAFKAFATLFALFAFLMVAAAWRMASAPMVFQSAAPYIERGLTYFIPETIATVSSSVIEWDNKKQLLSVKADGIVVKDKEGEKVASVEAVDFKVRFWGLLRGRLLPQDISLHNAEIWMQRDENGLVTFAKKAEPENSIVKGETIDFALLQLMLDEISNANLKHFYRMKDVSFHVRDKSFGQDWNVTVPEVMLSHDKRKSDGRIVMEIIEQDKKATLFTDYRFDFDKKLHHVSSSFRDVKPSVFATRHLSLAKLKIAELPVSGDIDFSADRDLNISQASLKIIGGKGFLNETSLWDKPRAVDSVELIAEYSDSDNKLNVSKAEVNFGGPRLNVTVDAKIAPPKDVIWLRSKLNNDSFKMTVMLDDLPMDQFGSVWPKNAIPDARAWILSSMSKGVFTHGEVILEGRARLDDLENLTLTSGGGKVYAKDAVINYLEGMPAVEGASAEATFDLDHMDVKILTGNTGAVKIQPFTLVMDHFQEDVQHITIPLRLLGPVRDVLTILDAPRLGYAKQIGLKPEDSSGLVEGTLTLKMPLLDSLLLKDVGILADAKISGFGSKNLVPGIELSEGNLALDLTKDGFTLRGGIGMNKVPTQLTWRTNFRDDNNSQPLHDGTITALMKGEQWGLFYGLDSLGKISGDTPATVRYTNFKPGQSRVAGQVNLKNAAVRLRDIGWDKQSGAAAQLSFVLDINKGHNLHFTSIEMLGPGIKVKGTADLDEDSGKLVSLQFKPFILGRNNATVSYLKPVDTTKPLEVSIDGESFDMFGWDEEKERLAQNLKTAEKDQPKGKALQNTETRDDPEKTRPKSYKFKLNKLYTSEDGYIVSMKGHAQKDKYGWKDIDIWGVAQGTTPVTVKLLTDRDHLAFNMNSDNFGTALQGFGFGQGVKSGHIEVNGESTVEDPRTIVGKIKIDSFTVDGLPVLARLLSAVSPFGFVDMITGSAGFNHLRADYKWKGEEVELKDFRATGSVVGINLDGRVSLDGGKANLSGTLVPFSFMNSIIGAIPLLGDVITGGSGGGIIAASFTARGTLSNPEISVNPVSLLAPGILRSLLFSADDGVEVNDPGQQPVAPLPVPKPEAPKSKPSGSKRQ